MSPLRRVHKQGATAGLGRACVITAIAIALSACAAPHWDYGSYNRDLYRHYTSGGYTETFIEQLSNHIEQLESAQREVPPGLYAELGTLYFEAGDMQRTLHYYQREYDHWPESRAFMGALIQNLSQIQRQNGGLDAEESPESVIDTDLSTNDVAEHELDNSDD